MTRDSTLGRIAHSCGCLSKELTGARARTHGMKNTREYAAWADAKQRCFNTHVRNYAGYGGRGITMCDRWRRSFAAFFEDMGPRPDGQSLDRINNDGHYEPGNCRWASRSEQARNKRNTQFITIDGETLTIPDAAARLGISPIAAYKRMRKGHI